jgi:hypothetical protein
MVYYGAVVSLDAEACLDLFGKSREVLLAKYRSAAEAALIRSEALSTTDTLVQSSLVLYLLFLRNHEPKLAWLFLGTVTRVLHETHLDADLGSPTTTPWEKTVSERFSVLLFVMDVHLAEEFSSGSITASSLMKRWTVGSGAQANPPRIISDVTASVASAVSGSGSPHDPDMIFFLSQCEVASWWSILQDYDFHGNGSLEQASVQQQQKKRRWLVTLERHCEERYMNLEFTEGPLHWVIDLASPQPRLTRPKIR